VEKTCRVCGEPKPHEDFYRAADMKDGRRSECKACNLAAQAARYRRDPEPKKQRVRQWQQENRDRHLETQRKRRQRPENKRKERAGHLRRKYGMTVEDYDALLASQGGVCAICRRPPRDDISLHVDHDHTSGTRRGLLCFRCNNSLGDLEDDPDLLRRAAAYLDEHDPEVLELTERARRRVAALTS
jgi:hypothetical protein